MMQNAKIKKKARESTKEVETTRQTGQIKAVQPIAMCKIEQLLSFAQRADVVADLAELVRVVLQDVPVPLQRVQRRRVARSAGRRPRELRQAIVHLSQLQNNALKSLSIS
jgi:hypothetical protein